MATYVHIMFLKAYSKNSRPFRQIILSSRAIKISHHKDGRFAGDIGGICGVFIGFSFISIVELLYFFAVVLRDLLCKKSSFLQEDDNHTDENPSAQAQTIRAIYWKELLPRSWHSAKYGKFSTNRARY